MKRIKLLMIIFCLLSMEGNGQNLSFSGGNAHSVMLCNNGEVYTTGRNNNGQLGTNGAPAQSLVLVKVLRGAQPVSMNNGTHLGSIRQVDAGSGAHNVALACNGSVWTWGWNSFGQLGDNTQVDKTTPVQVLTGDQGDASGFLRNVIQVSGGNENSYAIMSDGRLMSWGLNSDGQLGDGTTTNRLTPVYVRTGPAAFLTQVIMVDGGDDFGVALRADGTVWTWGVNGNMQLGQNNSTSYSYATQVFRDAARTIPLTGIVSITAGDTHVMALASDGSIWTWGGNWAGQLGFNTGGANTGLPGQVTVSAGGAALTGVTAISAGNQHSMAVLSNGTLVTWGGTNNYQGQTGTGAGSNYPTAVPGLTNIVSVSDGDLWTFAANSSGTVYAFGQNGVTSGAPASQWLGSLGINSSSATQPTPTAVTLPCGLTRECVDAYLGADITLCNPPSTTLVAPPGAATVQYRWKRDGVLLPNTSSSLFVNTAGTYRLIMWDSSYTNGCGYCPPDSDDVVVTNASPVVANNANFCAPPCQTPTLSVTGSAGNNYDWYASQFGGVSLNGAPSASFTTPCISSSTTYWVEDRSTQRCTAGYGFGQAPLNTSSNQWYTGAESRMTFDVLTSFTLDSVTIRFERISHGVCAGVPSAQGIFNVIIRNSGGTAVATINPLVPCGSGFVTVTIPIGYTFPVGNDYLMEFGGGVGTNVTYFANGANYATVQECGWINFDGSPSADGDDWPGFYNWQLRVGTNSCGRTPVQAILNCTLPVEFIDFNLEPNGNKVLVNWSTSSEKNNSHFTIQRSSDGINFQSIGTVQGNGSTNLTSHYSFVDHNPLQGIAYYRIIQNDFNGESSTSEVKVISMKVTHVSLYPNPYEDNINLNVLSESENVQVMVLDMTGKILIHQDFETNRQHQLGGDLAPGFYIIRIISGAEVKVFKIEKIK